MEKEKYILSNITKADTVEELYRIEGMTIFARHFNMIDSIQYLSLMDKIEKKLISLL